MKPPTFFEYLKDRNTILAFIADIVILLGIVYFRWDGPRIVAFYCLELMIMGFFFFLYLYITDDLDIFSFIIGFTFFSAIAISYFALLISFKTMVSDSNDYPDITKINLFAPYYDVALFLVIISISQIELLRKLLKIKARRLVNLFEVNFIGYRMVMMLIAFFGAALLSVFTGIDEGITPVITFIVMKDVLEYWKYKALIKMQAQFE